MILIAYYLLTNSTTYLSLQHTKRTGWVLRDINDCESISGHMYRMSILTFLLDGTEGLNQIRCMELALVHDLAESLVGDITPFCGISKDDKKAMELKAMEDICKLIEPRGKRMMELFEVSLKRFEIKYLLSNGYKYLTTKSVLILMDK